MALSNESRVAFKSGSSNIAGTKRMSMASREIDSESFSRLYKKSARSWTRILLFGSLLRATTSWPYSSTLCKKRKFSGNYFWKTILNLIPQQVTPRLLKTQLMICQSLKYKASRPHKTALNIT